VTDLGVEVERPQQAPDGNVGSIAGQFGHEIAEVVAGGEVLSFATERDQANIVIASGAFDGIGECCIHGNGDRVASIRPGEDYREDVAFSLDQDVLAHWALPRRSESGDGPAFTGYAAPNSPKPGLKQIMKFFADTAEIAEIRDLAATGLLDGVTTNPSLIHKSGRDFLEVVKEIAGVVEGPVSAEVVALDHVGMMQEAEVLRKIADNIAIKVPLTEDGLKTCKALTSDGTMVNVTLCFSAAQALLAAKAGATFISPFVGRHDDVGFDGMALIADIRLIYDNYDYATQILVASVRHPMHVVEAAKIGADVMTAPPKIIHQLFKHPLTDNGIMSFLADWEKTGQKIG
jgi:transaldolase